MPSLSNLENTEDQSNPKYSTLGSPGSFVTDCSSLSSCSISLHLAKVPYIAPKIYMKSGYELVYFPHEKNTMSKYKQTLFLFGRNIEK